MLVAKGIYKSYGDLPILKGIDLSVEKQEVVCIVGASGAGKTTLLQIMGTLDRPDQGSLYLNDTNLLELSGKKLAAFRNKKLGFIFQFHQLLPEFNAIENVILPAILGDVSKAEAMQKGEELLSFLGLKDRLTHKPSQLSGGEQQRVAVARALINSPEVIFADEPSGNLDSKNSRELHELFFKLKEEMGQTFVIVTHNPELANMADKKYEMKDGLIVQ
ncbi:ABC transporter ATP-binding protein [Paracrocinitomix mangrovi]|uniref:ABC transporter ATP-binding protein n=1 Tax=Paracrocinitomix mangrovi TaxID=2862509 RepID=UPI001C8E0528|nr:ABC transporter ATP-binding protein [Paracrocinitomix mangrovi]UKN02370.1 ABC transporter ATP-binding protein [Paracrocinitomix mangrovi]